MTSVEMEGMYWMDPVNQAKHSEINTTGKCNVHTFTFSASYL